MERSARLNGQAGFALVLIVFATVYASQIPELGLPFEGGREPGPAFMPIVLVALLYVAAIRVFIAELRGTGADPAAVPAASDTVPRVHLIGPLVLVVLTGLFAAGLLQVGYFVAAGAYTFGVALYFNYEQTGRPVRALLQSAVTAAAITGFGWLFFEQLFDLPLPAWAL